MYQSGYICSQLSIIDIGCWIADNSIVWSKFLSNNGKVFTIDPSSENLNFGKMIAKINNIENIKWVQAVCAEREGIRLNFDGSIDHTSFYRATSENYLISKSIDSIIMDTRSPIGLLHVDVEGFELSVLKGSKEVILRDRPVISFEQHISKENLEFISKYLKSYNYRIFMINEVLPGNALDCRNFLALPKEKGLPRTIGHTAGVEAVKTTLHLCSNWGIGALTVYAFSTENWSRPSEEVNFLMRQMLYLSH